MGEMIGSVLNDEAIQDGLNHAPRPGKFARD
jgi:hypothetical protein